MNGTCATCGRAGPVEAHHVAGRANHATATVNVCPECHRWYSTAWQNAAGVELHHDAPRSEADELRALVVGAFGALVLSLQRTPGAPQDFADAAIWAQNGWSRLLDLAENADRPGRWTPEADQPLPAAEPVTDDDADPFAAWAGMAAMIAPLASQAHGEHHPVTRVIERMRRDPAAVASAIEYLLTDPARGEQAQALLAEATRRAADAAREVLAVPNPATADADTIGPLTSASRALLIVCDQAAELLAAVLDDDRGCAA